uniref:BTB domain-containing protein n=1 Tax=Caenorhabditis tropicalis TaxID=1561998 RepID=A0A1I7T4G9_9PELO
MEPQADGVFIGGVGNGGCEMAAGGVPALGISSQTEIKVEKVQHTWTVKNFSHCYQEYLENFVYLQRGDEQLTWSIKIYPKGNGENNKDFVFLCLNRVVNNNVKAGKIGFKSQFKLRTAENKDIEMRIHPNPSHSDYVSYIKRDVLFPQIMPRDMIIVNVEIDVAVETITTTNEPIQFEPVNTEQQLIEDYQKLFSQELLTDFTINVNGRIIRTHKAVLAARSPVFNAMLTHHDTDEAKSSVMYINDMDFDVIYEMVYYIYCGRCQKDITDMATALLIAADKYRLEELKSHCEKYLVENINVDNACSLLIIGDLYTAPKLRRRAVQYFLLQFILARPKNVTGTPGWDDILKGHPNLITDIFSQIERQSSTGATSSVSTLPGVPMEIPGLPGNAGPPPSGL